MANGGTTTQIFGTAPLINGVPIVDPTTGRPTVNFMQNWGNFIAAITAEFGSLTLAQQAADTAANSALSAAQASQIASNAALQAVQASGSATAAYNLANSAYNLANVPITNVASLPVPILGQRGFVTDSASVTFYDPVVGGGSNATPVFATTTMWLVG